jgi:cytochrome P450
MPSPPGHLGLPLLGETLDFLRDPAFSEKRQQRYGSVFKTHLFGQPTLVMIGPEANRFLLTHENQYFVSSLPPSTKALLGPDSLSLQMGAIHQKRRKLLSQAFQPRILADYIAPMEQITWEYLHRWENMSPLTWYPQIKTYTLDIACKLLVGVEGASQRQLGKSFEVWLDGLFSVPIPLPWTVFGRALRSRQQLLEAIAQIVQQRQAQADLGTDTLGLLLQAEDEDGDRLTLDELKDQILTLLFAGHETLTSAITSFCLLLAQHPSVLAIAQAEQQQFDINQPLTVESLKQMPYLDQVLKEVLRLIPPVGGGFRTVIQDCEFNGYSIPKGWFVLYQINRTHQDQGIYQQPEQFDPDRFSPERAEDKSKPFSYVPFGGGMRECLGREFAKLEMKIFAALLIRHYEWVLVPDQVLELDTVPTPRPHDGLKVYLKKRSTL